MYQNKIGAVLSEVAPHLGVTRMTELVGRLNTLVQEEVKASLSAEVPARVARLILALQTDQNRCVHGDDGFDFVMTQGAIADAVGASRSYVSTLINEWKVQGILRNYGRTMCVVDLAALKKIANDPA